jgi:hypothetical protein
MTHQASTGSRLWLHKIYIAKVIIIKPHCLAKAFKSTSTPTPTLFLDIVLALTMRSHSTDTSFSDEDNHLLPDNNEAKASHQV